MKKNCPICDKEFYGRIDKKYCSIDCKNKLNNQLRTPKKDIIIKIDTLLHRNHHILSMLTKYPKTIEIAKAKGINLKWNQFLKLVP